MQTDTRKAEAEFLVGIDAAPFTSEAEGIALQMDYQHGDRNY